MAAKQQSLFDILGNGTIDATKYASPLDIAAAGIGSHYNPNVQDGMSAWTPGYQPWVDTGVQDGMHAAPNPQNTAYELWRLNQTSSRTGDIDPAATRVLDGANASRLPVWISKQSPELQKILSSPIASTSYAKKVGVDQNAASQALLSQLGALQQAGLNYGNKAGSAESQMGFLANDLARYGVSDLNNLKAYQVKSPTTGKMTDIFYDSKTGAIVPTEFGSNMSGEGGTYYSLKNVNGKAIPVGSWTDTSEAGDFLPALSILTMPLTAGLTSALAPAVGTATGLGAAGATALTGAGIQGLTSGALSAAAGGDFGKGFLTGAVGSGIGSGISALNPAALAGIKNAALASAVNKGLSGGLGGLAGAAINGRDAGQGALSGLISGTVSGALNPNLKDIFGNDTAGNALSGFLSGQAGRFAAGNLLGTNTPRVQGPLTQNSVVSTPASQDLPNMDFLDEARRKRARGALSMLQSMQNGVPQDQWNLDALGDTSKQRLMSGLGRLNDFKKGRV